ncbi:helix-turn-helix domain-containing protein [Haloglomus halophilum]|uniref:helix-turn-helix domain-containing protein n=1 Tax=Haloglomus halophilum TaxID=2962672 RepID=UPI0020C9DC04|nr:helix-turn-helix domain-containing protein [Haloglomus halophilum]
MRFVTGTIKPDKGFFQPMEEALMADPEVRREAIHHLDRLADGSAVAMYEISGDPDRIMGIIQEHDQSIGYQVTRGEGTVLEHAHFEPTPVVDELLDMMEEYEFAIDMPMIFTDDGRLRVTLIANDNTISEVFASVPEDIHFEVERTGEYEAGSSRIFSLLTERQREVLRAAIECGYYQEPREATHADVADAVGLTATTVGEHLRRIEATLMNEVVP